MHDREIDDLGRGLVSVVSMPSGRAPVVARDTVIVGLDTEFRPADGALLSVQFAVLGRDGKPVSAVVYPSTPKVPPEWLAAEVYDFLRKVDRVPVPVRGVRRVVLVAHYAAAELGGFDDPLRDLSIRQIGKAHHARLPGIMSAFGEWSLQVVDLFAYFKTSLEQVGLMIALPKIPEDQERLEELLRSDRQRFEAYAKRDAEIAVVAFEGLREKVLKMFGLDILRHPTLPSVAAGIFKSNFLKIAPVPAKNVPVSTPVKRASGWRRRSRILVEYAGSKDVRYAACRSYQGGRVEVFVQGLVVGPVVERDAVSLYPSAALLQPLPNVKTKWAKVTSMMEVQNLEGFGHFKFSFPVGQLYPCLPVTREGANRLCFTQAGETWCTLAEVRAALLLGADVDVVNAWGFEPGPLEREHDLARYIYEFMEQKNAATKGTLEYETAKLFLNGLIGKFGEHVAPSRILELERYGRLSGAPGLASVISRSSMLRGALKGAVRVGSLWVPEWASLIVGKARALMATIAAKQSLLLSTDAVIVPPDADLTSPGLEDLRTVGSDMEVKAEGDALFVARCRLYALLQRADRVRPGVEVLARDDQWAVVRVARHATPETKTEFAETVLRCIAAGKDVAPTRTKTRLLTAESAARGEGAINEEVTQDGRTYFHWDGKRRLADWDVNPFRSSTATAPYLTLGKLEAAEHQREVRAGTARRQRERLPANVVYDAVEKLKMGVGVRQVARDTGIPVSTVSDMKQRMLAATGARPAAGPALR